MAFSPGKVLKLIGLPLLISGVGFSSAQAKNDVGYVASIEA